MTVPVPNHGCSASTGRKNNCQFLIRVDVTKFPKLVVVASIRALTSGQGHHAITELRSNQACQARNVVPGAVALKSQRDGGQSGSRHGAGSPAIRRSAAPRSACRSFWRRDGQDRVEHGEGAYAPYTPAAMSVDSHWIWVVQGGLSGGKYA
jgi:hypothetical protein